MVDLGAQAEKVHLQRLKLGIFLSSPSPALLNFGGGGGT